MRFSSSVFFHESIGLRIRINCRFTIFDFLVNSPSYWRIPLYLPRIETRQVNSLWLLAASQYAVSNYLPRIETRQVNSLRLLATFLHIDQAVKGGKFII